ncbi:MAG: hypothetical protein RKH07_15050 [Gammaproteobacteria bacterium]
MKLLIMKHLRTKTRILCALLVVFTGAVHANPATNKDYAALGNSIERQRQLLQELEAAHGRYDNLLVEPLQRLTMQQLEVNRLGDAASSIDRAIQITRMAHGLYTPQQYDLLELSIDVEMQRENWDNLDEQIDHYTWLLGEEFSGSHVERIERVMWIANTHARAAFLVDPARRSRHLIDATRLNEFAVSYAHATRNNASPLYVQSLYDLTQKYYLETRAILGGGKTSYELRLLVPEGTTVDRRGIAIAKRYEAGLTMLKILRNAVSDEARFGSEARALVQLYMADWMALYDETDNLEGQYQKAIAAFTKAGVSTNRVAKLLASPVAIPRPELELTIRDAMGGAVDSNNLVAAEQRQATDAIVHRVRLVEPSTDIPGYAQEVAYLDSTTSKMDDWASMTVTMTLDPLDRVGVWNGSYRTKSRITGTNIETHPSVTLGNKAEKRIINRIKTLSFRPAFVAGKPVASELAVEFFYTGEAQDHTGSLWSVTGTNSNWVTSYPGQDPNATPAAAGE